MDIAFDEYGVCARWNIYLFSVSVWGNCSCKRSEENTNIMGITVWNTLFQRETNEIYLDCKRDYDFRNCINETCISYRCFFKRTMVVGTVVNSVSIPRLNITH